MSRYLITLNSSANRALAMRVITAAPNGTRVEVKAVKRSGPQNDRMWAMLSDVALQLPWHEQKLRADDWKLIFLDALKRDRRVVPNLDGDGFVDLGRSSSDLSRNEMGNLLDLIAAFGAQHGVVFGDESEQAA